MRALAKVIFDLGRRGLLPRRAYSTGYLRENYLCNEAWSKRLQSPLLQKVNPDDLFFEMDQKYQTDKVLSAVDVDIYMNRVTDLEALDEMEEVAYRLRKSPATADSLPSTSHALIRAFLKGQRTDELIRILNDRINYGVFLDFHVANILMNHFLQEGNHRDAAKIASLVMLEEDFGPRTTQLFCLLSGLKYIQDPKPEPWEKVEESTEEEEKEEKARVNFLRNVYMDQHYDLHEPHHLVGKTVAKVGELITEPENETLRQSIQLLGWAVYGKWDKVQNLLKNAAAKRMKLYPEVMKTTSELLDKAIAQVESSPTKSLPYPQIRQIPGMNVWNTKEVEAFWKRIGYPDYSKILPDIKGQLSSQEIPVTTDGEGSLLKKAEELLSAALSEMEDTEIQQLIKTYEDWDVKRKEELEKQIQRFKTFKMAEDIEARKTELKGKEEVIFFFDHEEEWMMKLPPDEQTGYRLPEKYIPSNAVKFVRSIPPKKIKKKKSKVAT